MFHVKHSAFFFAGKIDPPGHAAGQRRRRQHVIGTVRQRYRYKAALCNNCGLLIFKQLCGTVEIIEVQRRTRCIRYGQSYVSSTRKYTVVHKTDYGSRYTIHSRPNIRNICSDINDRVQSRIRICQAGKMPQNARTCKHI